MTLQDRITRPFIIGITGASGSGKTFYAKHLAKALSDYNPTLIAVDSYYKELSHLAWEERCNKNFDEPDAIDSDLFEKHILDLLQFNSIPKVSYNFAEHNRNKTTERVPSSQIIILEGIFTFQWEKIRALLDYKVMIETDLELCFSRRLKRDVEERGRTPESVISQYKSTVEPAIELYILPQSCYADLRMDGAHNIYENVEQTLSQIDPAKYQISQEDLVLV